MRKLLFWVVMLLVLVLYLGLAFYGASLISLSSSQTEVSDLQARVEILKSLTEAIALVVAGIWAYEVYIKNRYDHPYPRIQHKAENYDLGNGLFYLSVFVTVTNEGKTNLDLGRGKIYVRQVLPIPEVFGTLLQESIKKAQDQAIRLGNVKELFIDSGRRLGWDALGSREWSQLSQKMKHLEPGQTREIQFAFLIEKQIKVIEVISFFEYSKSSWEWTTLHSLK